MADTLTHPPSAPTTTITFDGIIDFSRGRNAVNSEDFGSIDGDSRQAASNRTKGDTQISFIFVSDSVSSVREKVKALEELYIAEAEDDMKITLNFSDGGTVVYVGKVVDERGVFIGGMGAVKYVGTIDMNVGTVTWS